MLKIKNEKAFTIIELIVTIVVIAILSGLAIATFSGTREEARDNARQGKAVTIGEALEKYYEQNGEYPSVASISNDGAGNTGAAVAAKLSIPAESLIMPEMPSSTTNAITSDPEPHDDYLAYVAQSAENNDACQNDVNGGCDQFTLRYLEESGETKVIESRRTLREIAQKPDLTVTSASSSSVNASWSSVAGATSYTLQRSLSSDMGSPTVTSHASTSASATGLSAGVTYYFRVQANLASGTSEWSDVESVTTNGIAAPTGTLTIVASTSGTNAVGTAGGGSCAGGTTIERQIRYSSTSTSTAGGWSSYVNGASRSVAASEGWQYTFQQQARCTSGGSSSGWVSSGTSSTVRPITSVPPAPVLTSATSSTNTVWNWGDAACPTGTSGQYQVRRLGEWGYDSGWGSPTSSRTWTWTGTEAYIYTLQVQARCTTVHSTGNWGSTGSKAHTAPVNPPAAPSSFIYYLRPDRMFDSWSWTAPSCGSGKRADFYENSYITGAGWYWVATGQEGWRYGTNGWSARTNAAPYYGTNNESPYPYNSVQVQHKAKYVCVHLATGRISADGPVGISALVTVP